MINLILFQTMSKDFRPFQNGLRYLNTWKITSLQMVSFFSKKNTLPLKMRSYGLMNSKDSYFSLMVKPPLVVLLLVLWVLNILNIKRDNLGRILVIEVKIDENWRKFVLINIYNANTESEQLHTLNDLINIPETFEDIQNKSVV